MKGSMEFSRKRIIKLVVMLIFLCCMIFANFVAIRMIMRYGVDTYFYDKLLVAYTVGGAEGLKLELGKIPFTDKAPREVMLANDFAVRLKTLTDPETFLKDKVLESKKMISSVRNLRNVAIFIMFILFCWQLIVNSKIKFKPNKSS
jgi:hypothetical protein